MSEIEIRSLSKNYGAKAAVKPLTLNIEKGELYGLLGVNGAGKTTIVKILSCLSKPTDGDAFVGGFSINNNPEKVKEITNVSPQETAIAPNLSVKENLILIARLYGADKKTAEKRTNTIINDFSLNEVENQKSSTLSGGWQRRLSIALSLVTEPQILFLDEPTLGLDVLARRELWDIIKSLKGKITMTLTTHYLEEAEALCDRIAVMADGELKAVGTVSELKEKAQKDDFEDAFIEIAKGGEKA